MAYSKEESIAMMNALGHAMKIMELNRKGDTPIDIREVITLAKKIALVTLAPGLEEFKKGLNK